MIKSKEKAVYMERDSIIYKTRRKMQVLAHKLLPDEVMSKIYFRIVLKKKLNIKEPKTFNEKLQWLKLYHYPYDDEVITCADKYAVRAYLEKKGYGDKLVPLAGEWDKVEDIDWEKLPNQFVLKCNHGCAYNILCMDKSTFDTKTAEKKLKTWMKEDFGAFNIEKHYSKIKNHKIICEVCLGECITDYKFFCFNGEPKLIYVSNNMINDRQTQMSFYNLDGSKMALTRDDYMEIQGEIEFPPFYEEMKQMAKELAEGFPFVRVDYFVLEDEFYFAELTFTPCACMMPFNPEEYDLEWGKMLDISNLEKKHG